METEARVQQRQLALYEANRIRTRRREIKEQLASGKVELTALILEPPTEILTAAIGEVLVWMPGIGAWRAAKILSGGPSGPGVGRMVRMGHLSEGSRRRICERIELNRPIRVMA